MSGDEPTAAALERARLAPTVYDVLHAHRVTVYDSRGVVCVCGAEFAGGLLGGFPEHQTELVLDALAGADMNDAEEDK